MITFLISPRQVLRQATLATFRTDYDLTALSLALLFGALLALHTKDASAQKLPNAMPASPHVQESFDPSIKPLPGDARVIAGRATLEKMLYILAKVPLVDPATVLAEFGVTDIQVNSYPTYVAHSRRFDPFQIDCRTDLNCQKQYTSIILNQRDISAHPDYTSSDLSVNMDKNIVCVRTEDALNALGRNVENIHPLSTEPSEKFRRTNIGYLQKKYSIATTPGLFGVISFSFQYDYCAQNILVQQYLPKKE